MDACARAGGINIPPTHNLGPTLQLPFRVKAALNKGVKLQCKDGGTGVRERSFVPPLSVSCRSDAARRPVVSATVDDRRDSGDAIHV